VQITPWNFPLIMATAKIAPALAAGCTLVLKPAEQTSLTALRLGDLVLEAGFPPGVVNIVTGRGATAGDALTRHPGVDKIAFTGSTVVGKTINRVATDTLKRVTLELGGKSPMIVMPDVDIPSAASGAASAIFFNSGQVCIAGSRLFAHRSVFEQLSEAVVENAKNWRVGPALDPESMMGPLVSDIQQRRVMGYIEQGRKAGAASRTSFVSMTLPADGSDCRNETMPPCRRILRVNRLGFATRKVSVQTVRHTERPIDNTIIPVHQGRMHIERQIRWILSVLCSAT
jgi:phenylacetaldehyde dehydrogenase